MPRFFPHFGGKFGATFEKWLKRANVLVANMKKSKLCFFFLLSFPHYADSSNSRNQSSNCLHQFLILGR